MEVWKKRKEKFTRIYTDSIDVSDWTNTTVVKEAMTSLIDKSSFPDTVADVMADLYVLKT